MGDQTGGNVRFEGPGSQWKSSWKGHALFSEFCCFEGFSRDGAASFYEEPGGALNIVPAAGYWLNFIVGIAGALPAATDVFIARNSLAPNGWELIATRAVQSDGSEGVSFTFRVYGGAVVVATTSSLFTYSLARVTSGLIVGSLGFRISAFFLPPTGPAPNGLIALAVEGSPQVAVALTAPYANAVPDLFLGIGTGVPAEDWLAPQTICGLAGGEGDYAGVEGAAHTAWIDLVAGGSELVAMPSTVSGTPIVGFTADNGWRGNNPYLSPGTAPDPLAPFIGVATLVEAGGTGDLTTVCGMVTFAGVPGA